METINVTFKTITPLFLGGAEPYKTAELRVPSIKAALRYWYRAIDPEYKTNEPRIFGSTDEGQGIFLMKIESHLHQQEIFEWDKSRYHPVLTDGTGTHSKNGVIYFGFPLAMKYNRRKYVMPGKSLDIRFLLKRSTDAKYMQGLLASIWLLGHIGGLGSRSRRGFGTIAITRWTHNNNPLTALPIAHTEEGPEEWLNKFQEGKSEIKRWFQADAKKLEKDHPILSDGSEFYFFSQGSKAEKKTKTIDKKTHSKDYEAWELALNDAARATQDFRQCYNLTDKLSDYHMVKAHLAKNNRNAKNGVVAPIHLSQPLQRAAFGLPLTFRYDSLKTPKMNRDGTEKKIPRTNRTDYYPIDTTFAGVVHDRSASPIHVRIIQIADKCFPFYIRLVAPMLPDKEEIRDSHGHYPSPGSSILDTFCKTVLEPKSVGKRRIAW